jgi:hypothetical protein
MADATQDITGIITLLIGASIVALLVGHASSVGTIIGSSASGLNTLLRTVELGGSGTASSGLGSTASGLLGGLFSGSNGASIGSSIGSGISGLLNGLNGITLGGNSASTDTQPFGSYAYTTNQQMGVFDGGVDSGNFDTVG